MLEFACGTGGTALLHAPHVAHVRALDISPAMIRIAEGKAAEQGIDNVTFEVADFAALQVPEASYDAVLGMSILHLLDNFREVIASVHEVLRPGGIFVSSTLCMGDSAFRFIRYAVPLGKLFRLMPDVEVIREASLLEALTTTGFTVHHHWRPAHNKASFIVAVKSGEGAEVVLPVREDAP